MDNKHHNRSQQPPRYVSIDGILRPARPRQRPSAPLGSQRPLATAIPQLANAPNQRRRQRPYAPVLNQPASVRQRASSNGRWSKKRKIISSALVILLLGFGVGTWYGAQLLGSVDKVFHGNVFSDVHALVSQTKLKGEDQGRVNILLAGDSADDPNHGGAQLTDSIMVVSIDTQAHTGFMLSIPRDLWVGIPGWSHQKINAANDVTKFNQAGYPSGGMGQLEQIVQTNLGIPINYYALINYSAFKDAVNAIGGVTLNVQSSDPRGLFDPNIARADGGPLKLPNGVITLNGQTALNLARARGDPCGCRQTEYGFPQSDYNRTQHQRQMLTALAQKAQSVGVLANPIKVTQLFSSFGNNIASDLALPDVLRFIELTKGMDVAKLQPLALTNSGANALLTSYTAPDGEAALIPKAGLDNFGRIQQYYQQLTSNNPVVKEAPSVVVLNGGKISGLARKVATTLKAQGFNVVSVASANNQYGNSVVIDNTTGQKSASLQSLLHHIANSTSLTSPSGSAEAGEAQGYTADFVVVLGQDQTAAANPQP